MQPSLEYMGLLRHKNVNVCGVGATLMHMLCRFDLKARHRTSAL